VPEPRCFVRMSPESMNGTRESRAAAATGW
jgi:hypothetical protein